MAFAEPAWRGVAGALCTTVLGLGLARFAYTPMIPALIAAHWLSPGQAVYLGAANVAGYLAGALAVRRVARRLGVRRALRIFMVLASVSLLACAHRGGFLPGSCHGGCYRGLPGRGSLCWLRQACCPCCLLIIAAWQAA